MRSDQIKTMPQQQRFNNFIAMANDFNGSSYYRANPFYQQGYLPDGAYKNRKAHYLGELPQGEEFFQPTNKKHFQRVGYYSTIAEQKLMKSGVRQQNLSPIRDKEYFRSLNVGDIEGASTNTLISKGVKNKMKAQQQLAKRHYQQKEAQRYQRMKMLQKMQDQKKRTEALNKINKNIQPNYHQINKKLKSQAQQTKKQSPMPNNKYDRLQQRNTQMQQNMQQKEIRQGRMPQKDTMALNNQAANSYRSQLQRTQKEIKQLEQQLSQVREQRQRAQKEHETVRQEVHNITPVTYQNKYQLNTYLPKNQFNEPNPELNYSLNQPQPQQQLYNPNKDEQKRVEEHKIANLSLEAQLNEYRKTQDVYKRQEKMERIGDLSGRVTRQQHRRFNPTYLSYGSPSIGLAGKNIVKY